MESLVALRRSLFWVSTPIFFINFALPVKSKELGASALEVGGLFSLFTLSLLLFRPLVGYALDRLGRRVFLCISLLLYALAYAGYGASSDMLTMYSARFLQGLGAALLLLTVDAMTTDLTSNEDRATEMGKNMEAQTRATFVGATIGFSLVAALPALGWHLSFGLFTAMAVFAFMIALIKVPETHVHKPESNSAALPPGLSKLLIWLLPLGFVNALIMPMYLVYLTDTFTVDKRFLSWAFLPAGLVFAILPSKLGSWVDKVGVRLPLVVGISSLIVLYLALPLVPGFWLAVIVYTLSAASWALIEPARKVLTASLSGDRVAQGFGWAEMAFGAGAVLGPLVGGYLYDHYDHTWPFYLNAIVMLVALAFLVLWLRPGNLSSTIKKSS